MLSLTFSATLPLTGYGEGEPVPGLFIGGLKKSWGGLSTSPGEKHEELQLPLTSGEWKRGHSPWLFIYL